jgi:hypothetical protein
LRPPGRRRSGFAGAFPRRFVGGRGRALFAALLLLLTSRLHLRHVGRAEVDRLEQERREAHVLDRLADDLSSEREQQPRRFYQEKRRDRLVGKVAKAEEPGEAQVDQEVDSVLRLRLDLDLEQNFVDFVGDFLDVEVEANVDRRLVLPLEDVRSARALDRKVLDVLRESRDLRLVCVGVGAVAGAGGSHFSHVDFASIGVGAEPERAGRVLVGATSSRSNGVQCRRMPERRL